MAAQPKAPETTDDLLDVKYPDPMEFLTKDFIHPDNQAVNQREAQRWRLLGSWERLKLKRYVNSLAKQLRKAKYNQIVLERHQLAREFRKAKAAYRSATFEHDAEKKAALKHLYEMYQRGKVLKEQFEAIKPIHENFAHYQGWLDYERDHRKDLKAEAKREKRVRAEMRKESKWLEKLVYDVFRHTPGCHFTYKKDGEKEKTKVPKFERVIIRPDAHYFVLSASVHILWWHKWRLPHTVTILGLQDERVIANIRAAVKRQADWVYSETGQLMLRIARLDSPDALPRRVKWRDAMKYFPKDRADRFPYTVGVTEIGKFLWLEFASDANLLVSGKQGSGKSNLVNGIIAALATTHSPQELRFVLIDQKGGIEFTHWKELPHLLWDMVKTLDEVEPVLKRLIGVMKRRMAILEKAQVKSIDAYNKRVDLEDRMERLFLVVDELNTFVGLGQQTEDIHNQLMLLASQGRACGITVILATQYPEVRVIPNRIKGNVGVKLCGYVASHTISEVAIDSPEASRIPNMPGRMAGTSGLKTFIVQVPYIEDGEIADAVNALSRLYPDVPNELNHMKDVPKLMIWNQQRFIKAALEWMDGALAAQKLHKMIGADSPGERALSKLSRSLVEEYEAEGVITDEDGNKYTLYHRSGNKAWFLKPVTPAPVEADAPDSSDVIDEPEHSSALSEIASGVDEEPSPLTESAAD